MNAQRVCAIGMLAGIACLCLGSLASAAADVNFLKAVVVVELSSAVPLPKSADGKLIGGMYGQGAATIVQEATSALQKGLAPLQVTFAKAVQGAGNEAATEGAAYLIHVLIKDRRVDVSVGPGTPSYILKADCTVYRSPALKGGNPMGPWQKSATIPLECKGFSSDLGGASEYAALASRVQGVIMRDICPIQVLGYKTAGGRAQITFEAMNNTTQDIVGLTLAVPTSNPYITQNCSVGETIAPGAKKTVTVEVRLPYSHDGKTDLKFTQAYVSGVRFGGPGATPAAGRDPRKGRGAPAAAR